MDSLLLLQGLAKKLMAADEPDASDERRGTKRPLDEESAASAATRPATAGSTAAEPSATRGEDAAGQPGSENEPVKLDYFVGDATDDVSSLLRSFGNLALAHRCGVLCRRKSS